MGLVNFRFLIWLVFKCLYFIPSYRQLPQNTWVVLSLSSFVGGKKIRFPWLRTCVQYLFRTSRHFFATTTAFAWLFWDCQLFYSFFFSISFFSEPFNYVTSCHVYWLHFLLSSHYFWCLPSHCTLCSIEAYKTNLCKEM